MAEHNGGSFLWFLAGLGLGAVVGVLYAPKPGRETRDDLRAKAEDGREYVMGRARETADQAQQWVDRGRELFEVQKDQIRSAIEAGMDAYREATSEGPSPASRQQS